MKAYNQMMELQYQTKYRKILTVGEALRLLIRLDESTGYYLDVRG
jgi:hypothetical protein